MASIRVTCKNEEEVVKVLETAEKEGYTWWGDGSEATGYRPDAEYPYDITLYKGIAWGAAKDEKCHIARNFEKYYIAKDFITEYNSGNTEPFGISQKIKNKIILDFMKKWHEIRRGCAGRSCVNCKFHQFIGEDMICKLCDADDVGDEERFFNTVKLLIDVVASGDTRISQLTPNEAVEIIRKEIKPSYAKEDDEARRRAEALEMAVRALEERNDK